MVGSDAAPAALPRKQGLGRLRDPARAALRPLCEELSLDWDWAKPQPWATPTSPRPRKRGSETKIAAMERRSARASRWRLVAVTGD